MTKTAVTKNAEVVDIVEFIITVKNTGDNELTNVKLTEKNYDGLDFKYWKYTIVDKQK